MPEIVCGDCMDVLPTLEDNSVDMIFTDPPFGHNNNNAGDLISRWEAALGRGDYIPKRDDRPIANDGKEADELIQAAFAQFARILKPGGVVCCCCGGGGGPDPQFARWSLWLDEALTFKQMVVWDKGPMGMGWHYRRSYETVLVAHKGPKCNWYDDSHQVENVIRTIPKIIPAADQHPTQKPVMLAEFFINLHSKPGDLILDPFMGSGSTGVAAVKLGRRFIGIELDEHWHDMARKRIEEAETAPTLEGI